MNAKMILASLPCTNHVHSMKFTHQKRLMCSHLYKILDVNKKSHALQLKREKHLITMITTFSV